MDESIALSALLCPPPCFVLLLDSCQIEGWLPNIRTVRGHKRNRVERGPYLSDLLGVKLEAEWHTVGQPWVPLA
eukprot:4712456-Prymnesium_polylepis.1